MTQAAQPVPLPPSSAGLWAQLSSPPTSPRLEPAQVSPENAATQTLGHHAGSKTSFTPSQKHSTPRDPSSPPNAPASETNALFDPFDVGVPWTQGVPIQTQAQRQLWLSRFKQDLGSDGEKDGSTSAIGQSGQARSSTPKSVVRTPTKRRLAIEGSSGESDNEQDQRTATSAQSQVAARRSATPSSRKRPAIAKAQSLGMPTRSTETLCATSTSPSDTTGPQLAGVSRRSAPPSNPASPRQRQVIARSPSRRSASKDAQTDSNATPHIDSESKDDDEPSATQFFTRTRRTPRAARALSRPSENSAESRTEVIVLSSDSEQEDGGGDASRRVSSSRRSLAARAGCPLNERTPSFGVLSKDDEEALESFVESMEQSDDDNVEDAPAHANVPRGGDAVKKAERRGGLAPMLCDLDEDKRKRYWAQFDDGNRASASRSGPVTPRNGLGRSPQNPDSRLLPNRFVHISLDDIWDDDDGGGDGEQRHHEPPAVHGANLRGRPLSRPSPLAQAVGGHAMQSPCPPGRQRPIPPQGSLSEPTGVRNNPGCQISPSRSTAQQGGPAARAHPSEPGAAEPRPPVSGNSDLAQRPRGPNPAETSRGAAQAVRAPGAVTIVPRSRNAAGMGLARKTWESTWRRADDRTRPAGRGRARGRGNVSANARGSSDGERGEGGELQRVVRGKLVPARARGAYPSRHACDTSEGQGRSTLRGQGDQSRTRKRLDSKSLV